MSTSTVREAPGGASSPPGGPVRRQRGAGARSGPRAGAAITLTGRGGIVAMFVLGLLGSLLADWTGTPFLAGAVFLTGCVLAALLTRPADLLTLAVSPPLVFLLATFAGVLLTSLGDQNLLSSVLLGLLTALATTAPWLFAATVLVLVITAPRGMLAQLRELREKLAGMRLFMEEENEDPVRWDDTPSRSKSGRNTGPNHADVD